MKNSKIYVIIGLVVIYGLYLLLNAKDDDTLKLNSTVKEYRTKSNTKMVRIGKENTINNVTIVTMLIKIPKSKHSNEDYNKWSSKMIDSIGVPFVAYIDEYWSESFIKLCRERKLNGIVYIIKNIWQILNDLEMERNRNYIESYKTKQMKKDREKRIHSPELYAIWNLKAFIVNTTTNSNPYRSNFFIYTDCGAWRNKVFPNWPDVKLIANLIPKLNDRILFGQINEPDRKRISIYKDLMEATFFAGSTRAIRDYTQEFYRIHDEWLDKGLFIGKDQNMLNSLTYIETPHLIARLNTRPDNCTKSFDQWFFYQFYFAHEDQFICNVKKLSLLLD